MPQRYSALVHNMWRKEPAERATIVEVREQWLGGVQEEVLQHDGALPETALGHDGMYNPTQQQASATTNTNATDASDTTDRDGGDVSVDGDEIVKELSDGTVQPPVEHPEEVA